MTDEIPERSRRKKTGFLEFLTTTYDRASDYNQLSRVTKDSSQVSRSQFVSRSRNFDISIGFFNLSLFQFSILLCKSWITQFMLLIYNYGAYNESLQFERVKTKRPEDTDLCNEISTSTPTHVGCIYVLATYSLSSDFLFFFLASFFCHYSPSSLLFLVFRYLSSILYLFIYIYLCIFYIHLYLYIYK